jgi:molybdopterin converting factor small subunit
MLTLYPCLSELSSTSILAVNCSYVNLTSDVHVTERDEIAFIPPISGG